MPRHGKYPDEFRARAVRMVREHRGEYGSKWEAINSIADKLGPSPETVRKWVYQVELFFSILQHKVIKNGNFT